MHEGFYSNRTDLIRTAIRNQLATHADAVKQSIVRHTLELGLRRYSREDLEAVKAAGGRLSLVNVHDPVYEVFDVTRLVQVLDVHRGPGDRPRSATLPPLAS